jgi:uncharacterized protein DUF6194
MNETEMSQYLTETLEGVDVVTVSDNSFFFYNPDSNIPPDHRFPFATLMTNDLNDRFSNLDRPSVYRLNIGVSKQTFRALFGEPEFPADKSDSVLGGYDYTALDQVMPHPVYGRMLWVCVLNPSKETFETKVRPLLTEAYGMAVNKYQRKAARRTTPN